MDDSARLRKVINKKFKLKSSFDTFLKNNMSFTSILIEEWHKKGEEWNNKLIQGSRFHCTVCGSFTSNFNFIEYDDTYTSPERLWCIECETWWNCRNGFENTLNCLLYIKNKDENKHKEALEKVLE